jgi:hypothetical protein
MRVTETWGETCCTGYQEKRNIESACDVPGWCRLWSKRRDAGPGCMHSDDMVHTRECKGVIYNGVSGSV